MFLVLSSSFPFQPALAYHTPRPISAINSATTPDGTFNSVTSPDGRITHPPFSTSVPSGQTTARVTFRIAGADLNDANNHFECRLSGGSLPATSTFQSPCGTDIRQLRSQTIGATTYAGVLTANVVHDLGPSSTPYRFEVKVVNDGQSSTSTTTSSEVTSWTFTVRQTPASIPQEICGDGIDNNRNGQTDENCPPTVRFTRVEDEYENVISTSRPTTSEEFRIAFEARGQMLNRWCEVLSDGPLPVGITYGSYPGFSCHNIIPNQNEVVMQYGTLASGLGQKWYCVVVFDRTNIPSNPSCASWEVVRSARSPPTTAVGLHSAHTGSGFINVPNNDQTPYNNMYFLFNAIPNGMDRPYRPFFECRWDGDVYEPCGQGSDVVFWWCSPGGQCRNTIALHEPSPTIVRDVSQGHHLLGVRSRYIDSAPGPETQFQWCVTPTNTCVQRPDSYSPIQGSMISNWVNQSTSLPDIGLNKTILPDAGMNKIIRENETAKLSALIVAFKYALLTNGTNTLPKTTAIVPTSAPDIKSLLWKQIEGPEVKLNSTDTQAVEFVPPSVKNDTLLKFAFTVTDPEGLKATDTTSLLLVTRENAQKYKGNFCDAMVAKALEQINSANMTGGDIPLDNNNTSDKTDSKMEQARKYLGECQESLNQYTNQLGNITEIFPELNLSAAAGINATNIVNLTKISTALNLSAAAGINATTIDKQLPVPNAKKGVSSNR